MLYVEGILFGEGVLLTEPLGRYAEVTVVDVGVVEYGEQTLHVPVGPGEHQAREVPGRFL